MGLSHYGGRSTAQGRTLPRFLFLGTHTTVRSELELSGRRGKVGLADICGNSFCHRPIPPPERAASALVVSTLILVLDRSMLSVGAIVVQVQRPRLLPPLTSPALLARAQMCHLRFCLEFMSLQMPNSHVED
jgi:hypothetical protein